jgi:hypothetical protein
MYTVETWLHVNYQRSTKYNDYLNVSNASKTSSIRSWPSKYQEKKQITKKGLRAGA